MPTREDQLVFETLGRRAFRAAWEEQTRRHEEVRSGTRPSTVLFVEHDPVVTLGKRPSAWANVLADDAKLRERGIDVVRIDRGGDVTYHGPGQLVAYPIVRLHDVGVGVRDYVHLLEQAIIDTLGTYGVAGHRDPGAIGVWVERPAGEAAKVAAIGVSVRRWVTMHGLALNVTTDLDPFSLIVPCGLSGRPVTSLREILGEACPPLEQVRRTLAAALARRLAGE